jgi:putative aldouronate transport system permease protein
MRRTKGAVATEISLRVVMGLLSVLILFPFLYCVAYSLSDSVAVMTTNITIFPVGLTFENYAHVFQQRNIYNSFLVSVTRTVIGASYTLLITGLASYAISKRGMPGRRGLSIFLLIPMYISGGLIPTYVLMYKLKLVNSFLVYILPNGFWAFNMLLMRTYFDTIPPELEESAKLDGARDLRIFFKIIVPISMPIIAVIAMFSGVWQWNSWFDAMLYITKSSLKPLQAVLQELIMASFSTTLSLSSGGGAPVLQSSPEGVRMATLVFTTLPIVIVYPFFQKYFVQGVMIGAVKA